MDKQALLRLDGVEYRHPGSNPAQGGNVTGLSFELQSGQAMAIIGPNGAGKSTMLRGMLGLLPQFAGEVSVLPTRIAYLPQTASINPDFPITVRGVVRQGRYRQQHWWGRTSKADWEKIDAAIHRVALTDIAHKQFGELSGGQQQRTLLARAVAADPELLLLDEPLNGLDQESREQLRLNLVELKSQGVAVIIATHEFAFAREQCELSLLVNRRQLSFGLTPKVLREENIKRLFAPELPLPFLGHAHGHEHDRADDHEPKSA